MGGMRDNYELTLERLGIIVESHSPFAINEVPGKYKKKLAEARVHDFTVKIQPLAVPTTIK